MSIHNGKTYIITNAKSETVIDLSGTDGVSVTGWERHDGPNQRWTLIKHNSHWVLKNVWNGKYLGLAEDQVRNDVDLKGVDDPVNWDIYPDKDDKKYFRIFWPGTKQNVDMSDHGNPANGTRVTLWGKWAGKNQEWIFEAVKSPVN